MKLNHVCSTPVNDKMAMPDFPAAAASVKRGTENQTTMKLKLNTAHATPGVGSAAARLNLHLARLSLTAPSLRLPATRANRERLRVLRDAELSAWEAATPNAALRAEVQRSLATRPGEVWLNACVTAIAVGALLIGASSSLQFVAHWDHFASLVRTLIG